MVRRKGRTGRSRQKLQDHHGNMARLRVSQIGYDRCYVELMRWLQRNDFRKKSSLIPALFPDTGRGLMTLHHVKEGEAIVSIPACLLITTVTVMKRDVGRLIKRWQKPISALDCLCLFLVYEKCLGPSSSWVHYINVLPATYTNALYWESEELELLPADVKEKALSQRQDAFESFTNIQPLGVFIESQLPWLRGGLSWEQYRWAWSSINTRSVYMKQGNHSACICDPHKDCYALAPFLDLLNHSADVQVDAGFNCLSDSYEIRAITSCRKYGQVFISYGPHDNSKLLVEYGFILQKNRHNVVKVYLDEIQELEAVPLVNYFEEKLSFIKENELHLGMLWSEEGMSWNLRLSLEIIALESILRSDWQKAWYHNEEDAPSERATTLALHLLTQRLKALQLSIPVLERELNYKERLAVELRQQQIDLLQLNQNKLTQMT